MTYRRERAQPLNFADGHHPKERARLSYDLLVAKWDPVQPHHVRQAAAEYDQLGQDEFLARHGFGRALAYLLIIGAKN